MSLGHGQAFFPILEMPGGWTAARMGKGWYAMRPNDKAKQLECILWKFTVAVRDEDREVIGNLVKETIREILRVGTGSDPWLTESEVSEMFKVSVKLLQKWRGLGEGPKYVKLGNTKNGKVLYRKTWVDAYFNQNMVMAGLSS